MDYNVGLTYLNCFLSLEKEKTGEINKKKHQGEDLQKVLDSIDALINGALNTTYTKKEKEKDFSEDKEVRYHLDQLFKYKPSIVGYFHWDSTKNTSEYTTEACENIANTLKEGNEPAYANLYCLKISNFEEIKEKLEYEKQPILKAINEGTSYMNNQHTVLLASTQTIRKSLERLGNLGESIVRNQKR